MISLVGVVVVIAHVTGCINFYTANQYYLKHGHFPETSWTDYFQLDSLSVARQYELSLWRALDLLIMLEPDGGRRWSQVQTYQVVWIGYNILAALHVHTCAKNTRCQKLDEDWCMTEYWLTIVIYYMGDENSYLSTLLSALEQK